VRINPAKNYKILVIRLSSLGDIILTFPFLKELKTKLPDSQIHFISKDEYEGILKINPHINEIYTVNKNNLKEIRKFVKSENYDFIFDLHGNLRSLYISLFQNSKIFRYKKNNLKKLLLVYLKINLFKDIIPVYKKYLLTLRNLFKNVNHEFKSTELNIPETFLSEQPYIIISPSSKHFTKTYPKEKFLEIINRNKSGNYILTGSGSKKDTEICKYLEDKSSNTRNLCGKLTIPQLAEYIQKSDYVITNDSGVMHLAEALNKPVYVFFGSTVKEFGFYPQLRSSFVFENKAVKCRPCARSGRSLCPKKHFNCMLQIKQDIL
jgi:heptosyltransferase-2